ncbi:MAG TPA: sigma-54 dependent transcriptional regulator, partial [Planctomycetota bacterium]|nr:sigma-54 dependent transcriptional regulator [Planctomycetota bacterium]
RLRSGGRFDDGDLAFLADVARQLGAAFAALSRTGDAREETEAWRRLATRPARSRPDASLIVGESPALRAALEVAERVARADAAVLILGETGTGKELFARFVHDRSPRAQGPFVPLNCAAVPEALLESELFGHEKGAFTGADRRRRGLLELARGGTLFLDEVGEMPAALQAKLLRVLETRAVRRVGGEAEVQVDFRLVAATNRDLEREVRERRFREDLYYRLNVFSIRLPPLRDRAGDAERLAGHFLSELAARAGKGGVRFTAAALDAIRSNRWAGNVRELRNAVERAITLAEGPEVGPEHLGAVENLPKNRWGEPPHPPVSPPEGAVEELHDASFSLADAEKRAIIAALRRTGGKKGEAARLLGIAHPTLNRKLKEYGLNETFGAD